MRLNLKGPGPGTCRGFTVEGVESFSSRCLREIAGRGLEGWDLITDIVDLWASKNEASLDRAIRALLNDHGQLGRDPQVLLTGFQAVEHFDEDSVDDSLHLAFHLWKPSTDE